MKSETWKAYLRYMEMRALAAHTIRQRANTVRRLALASGDRPLTELTEDDLKAWAGSLAPLGRATRAVYISHVRSFYSWAYAEHRIPADPAANIPVPKVPRRKPRPISEDDLAAALEWAPARVRPWFVLAAWCGLRAQEIALLRAEDIHLRSDPPYLLVTADAAKGQTERVVPLSPFVVAELRADALPARGLCWRTFDNRPVDPGLVSKLCNRVLHEAGIPDTLHSLRHRFGTQVQRAVRDVFVTQQLLGHRSPVTTAGYADVADADRLRAVTALPVPSPRVASAEGPDAA